MYILREIYEEIVNKVPDHLPETGGILGAYNHVIRFAIFDNGVRGQSHDKCHYIPDVKYLNKCIAEWSNRGIDFVGIFHTHFFSVATLSDGDKNYIQRIMQVIPLTKKTLYFPIVVLPERKIVSYKCKRNQEQIEIADDSINLVEKLQL